MNMFKKLFQKKHHHHWKIDTYAGIYGVGYTVNDCDNVPMTCKCGARALAKWRKEEGMVEVNEIK